MSFKLQYSYNYSVQCCFDEIKTIATYIIIYINILCRVYQKNPYMSHIIKNEYIHVVDHIPYSKYAQEILRLYYRD